MRAATAAGHARVDGYFPDGLRGVEDYRRYLRSANIGAHARFCDVSAHVAQGLLHLEVEPQPVGGGESAVDLVHDMIVRIGVEDGEAERLHADVATHVRRLTGFDRVMVYTASSPTVPAR